MFVGLILTSPDGGKSDAIAPIYKIATTDKKGIYIDGKEVLGVRGYNMQTKEENSVNWTELSVTFIVKSDA
ncbi:MAG: hypothetical protein FWE11_09110 [Defluviitaleaceae bacterium]|nr:hypothetical protein [Defluviitaleaceae bacterium]